MSRATLVPISILVVTCLVFGWAQSRVLDVRKDRRVEEKVLLLSDRPEVTRTLALGFDNALADIFWIRAIQYFGGNFSTLDQEDKKEGMVNLFNNMVGLSPEFLEAWTFGGFVMNESIQDPGLAIDFLLRGTEVNQDDPRFWKLTFDAAFIMFYQLEDYDGAKQLFMQSAFGGNLLAPSRDLVTIEGTGAMQGYEWDLIRDGDRFSQVFLTPEGGSITLSFEELTEVGRIVFDSNVPTSQSFEIQFTDDGDRWTNVTNVTSTGLYTFAPPNPFEATALRFTNLSTRSDDGMFSVAEIEVYGGRNPDVPSYVERMAFEMDRASGRFSAAWNQFVQYYNDAAQVGDEVSMNIMLGKLNEVYNVQVQEILEQAVELHLEETGSLPSSSMIELLDGGYLQRVIMQRISEDPNFEMEVLPIIAPEGDLSNLLTTHALNDEQPQLLIVDEAIGLDDSWYVISRPELMNRQQSQINALQQQIQRFRDEEGRLPDSLDELAEQSWFSGMESMLEDPMGGRFVMQESGTIEAVDPMY